MDSVALFGSIPASLVLAVFLLIVYWTQAFFIIYHLVRFGIGIAPKIIALIFFMGSLVAMLGVFVSYTNVDLSGALEKFQGQYLRPLDVPKVPINL